MAHKGTNKDFDFFHDISFHSRSSGFNLNNYVDLSRQEEKLGQLNRKPLGLKGFLTCPLVKLKTLT